MQSISNSSVPEIISDPVIQCLFYLSVACMPYLLISLFILCIFCMYHGPYLYIYDFFQFQSRPTPSSPHCGYHSIKQRRGRKEGEIYFIRLTTTHLITGMPLPICHLFVCFIPISNLVLSSIYILLKEEEKSLILPLFLHQPFVCLFLFPN